MGDFNSVRGALEYIDQHLDEPLSFELLAEQFHFSAYYFHRMFSVVVGKSIACHIRDRRLLRACGQLAATDQTVLRIATDCGYNSAQAFTRAFRNAYGLSPSEYRKQGLTPLIVTADDLIRKFTNRLRGGILLNPKIIKRGSLSIAGASGDGSKTAEVWQAFMKLVGETPLKNKLSDNGYEIRVYREGGCTVHVGLAVSGEEAEAGYTIMQLPESKYASFDVYVASGYDSENSAMDEWLTSNPEGYRERLLEKDTHYCVEYYDERFNGSEAGSIVEIWVPVEKK